MQSIEHPLSPYLLEPFRAEPVIFIIFFAVQVGFGLRYVQNCGSDRVFGSRLGSVRHTALNTRPPEFLTTAIIYLDSAQLSEFSEQALSHVGSEAVD